MKNILKNIIQEFSNDPKTATNTFAWGRNTYLLTYDSYFNEITVLERRSYEIIIESSDVDQIVNEIYHHR